jgi:hypothetical protein
MRMRDRTHWVIMSPRTSIVMFVALLRTNLWICVLLPTISSSLPALRIILRLVIYLTITTLRRAAALSGCEASDTLLADRLSVSHVLRRSLAAVGTLFGCVIGL